MFSKATTNYAYTLVQLLHATGMSYNKIAVESNLSYAKIRNIVNRASSTSMESLERIERLAFSVADEVK